MSNQILKEKIPSDLLYDFCEKICIFKTDTYYVLNRSSFKKAEYNNLIDEFREKIKPYYHNSKVYYVEIDREIWHDSSIREKEKETIYINVPQGIDDNEVIVVKEKGHINKYNKIGDVKVHIKVDNNTEFIRNGIDLILHKHITLKESLCGFYFEFTHITGKIFRIHNKMGTIIAPEFKKKIDKLGMKRENHIGNLIILFHVKYPENIPIEKLKQIEEILE